ncbi:hypothetical protein C8A01DRAFT_41235 [Parachaetomium inaequale]|uniref:Uncharacterized protein n=1 Tax=Parachaetomium inaequale TaxID=2588326 RepID=A0AAN6P654_9PEZI|nr:hypothetical protein C8A01DRAFT_41235 [Parachaetomium inaequale]
MDNNNGLGGRNNHDMTQPNAGMNHPDDDRNDPSFKQERYKVYWVEHVLPPPAQRRSHFIFVNSRFVPMTPGRCGNQGKKFQVTGNISTAAMTFRVQLCDHPRTSDPTCWFEHIGWVLRENFEGRITAFNGTTPLFPGQQLRTCREWTFDVRNQLVGTGVMEPLRALDQGGDPNPVAGN